MSPTRNSSRPEHHSIELELFELERFRTLRVPDTASTSARPLSKGGRLEEDGLFLIPLRLKLAKRKKRKVKRKIFR